MVTSLAPCTIGIAGIQRLASHNMYSFRQQGWHRELLVLSHPDPRMGVNDLASAVTMGLYPGRPIRS